MSKYIDADRLKKAVEHELDMQDLYLPVHFFEVVDGMEAADVTEVVRCKDCKHRNGDYCHNADGFAHGGNFFFVRMDDYCSMGERDE